MTERSPSYIGVSGLSSKEQQSELKSKFLQQGLERKRILALGVKATHKTQYDDTENKYGQEWYPVGAAGLSGALTDDSSSLRVAQLYLEPEQVDDEEYRRTFLDRVRRRGAGWLNAVQFDLLPWHTNKSMLPFLEKLKQESGLTVLLQVHGEAMATLGSDDAIRKLGIYAGALDYLLFDASHGRGSQLNTSALQPFLDAAYASSELEVVGIGVAGGLCASVVAEQLPPLVKSYPDLSWDAEGQLHTIDSSGRRPLDLVATKSYIDASATLVRSVY